MNEMTVYKINVTRLLAKNPPAGHKGWTISACQEACRKELEAAGFDLDRKFACQYDPTHREIVFWQVKMEQNPVILPEICEN